VLRARLGPKRLRFTGPERRLLAEKGKPLGRKLLAEVASLATPETILRWYRERIVAKYDGSCLRGVPGRIADSKLSRAVAENRHRPREGVNIAPAIPRTGYRLGREPTPRWRV